MHPKRVMHIRRGLAYRIGQDGNLYRFWSHGLFCGWRKVLVL